MMKQWISLKYLKGLNKKKTFLAIIFVNFDSDLIFFNKNKIAFIIIVFLLSRDHLSNNHQSPYTSLNPTVTHFSIDLHTPFHLSILGHQSLPSCPLENHLNTSDRQAINILLCPPCDHLPNLPHKFFCLAIQIYLFLIFYFNLFVLHTKNHLTM